MLKPRELSNLLNRAAAALETPADLSESDRTALVEDLVAAAGPDLTLCPPINPPVFDNTQAETEGWAVFFSYGNERDEFRIERSDEAEVFHSDAKAWTFVWKKAKAGSIYHQDALDFIKKYSPREWALIRSHDHGKG